MLEACCQAGYEEGTERRQGLNLGAAAKVEDSAGSDASLGAVISHRS